MESVLHYREPKMKVRNPDDRKRLIAEFLRQYGKPLERVRGVRGARGTIKQLYRDPDGKLIRLRTNMDRCLVTNAVPGPNKFDADAPLILEGPQDFVGLAIPGPRGTVECYLIPNDRVIADLKESHRQWQATQPNGGKSDVRALFFYGEVGKQPWYGWQTTYAEFRLQASEVQSKAPAMSDDIQAIATDARSRILASLRDLPEARVLIGVDPTGKGNLIAWL